MFNSVEYLRHIGEIILTGRMLYMQADKNMIPDEATTLEEFIEATMGQEEYEKFLKLDSNVRSAIKQNFEREVELIRHVAAKAVNDYGAKIEEMSHRTEERDDGYSIIIEWNSPFSERTSPVGIVNTSFGVNEDGEPVLDWEVRIYDPKNARKQGRSHEFTGSGKGDSKGTSTRNRIITKD